MVAAAKLKRAQENAPKLLSGTGENKVHLCVVMTSDRGLCGGFNTNIIKKAKAHFEKIKNDGKILKIITVGSKGYDQLKRVFKDNIVEKISFKDSKNINYFDAEKVGKLIIDNFEKKEFDVCTIFYNKFKNVITQIPQAQQIIPLTSSEVKGNSSEDNYEFEPDEDEILSNLLPKNISTQIFKAMLENSASEQGSRMSAMDNATRNAGEMVDKLTCSKEGKCNFIFSGPGVERISEEVKKIFPKKESTIFSSDTMNKKSSLETLDKIINNKIPILIGTQLISKGFHFPNLNCIVVVDIDLSSQGHDLRGAEKNLQLYHQLSGRAGRTGKPATVLKLLC